MARPGPCRPVAPAPARCKLARPGRTTPSADAEARFRHEPNACWKELERCKAARPSVRNCKWLSGTAKAVR
jgi:hypothetical protein